MKTPPYNPAQYRLQRSDLIDSYEDFLNVLTNVPESPSLTPIWVNEAGILNQQSYIKLSGVEKDRSPQPMLCDVQIGVQLESNRRGIHMSRCEESLHELADTEFSSIDSYAEQLAVLTQQKQNSIRVFVKVRGTYIRHTVSPITKKISHDKIFILSEVIHEKSISKIRTGLQVFNICACPCTQTYIKYSAVPKLLEKGYSLEEIQEIIDITLAGTHTQRGRVTLMIDKTDVRVTTSALYNCIASATILAQELLKRPDEHDLVVRALKKGQFTEDVVRDVAKSVINHFHYLPDSVNLEVESVVLDSIHIHDIMSLINSSFGEIRKSLKSDKYTND